MQKNSVCRVAGCRRKYGLRRENPARPQPKPQAPRQRAACCATPRTSGQVERPESPRMRESIRLSPKRRGKACRNACPKTKACAARKLAASRKRTPARPFCGHAARGGRQSCVRPGIRHVQAALLSGADCARKPTGPTRRAGGRAPLLRGQKACPQAEHGSKKGKEQQKGLSSPGQSRKRKALFMFMGKR